MRKNNLTKALLTFIFCALLPTLFAACGGGGGGGAGSESDTGVRIINASIDAPPLDIVIAGSNDGANSTAFFGQSGKRVEIPGSALNIGVRSKNTGGIIANPNTPEDKNSAYSILVYGSAIDANLRTKLLNDKLAESEKTGAPAKVRFVNAVNKVSEITVSFGGKSIAVPYGTASEFLDSDPVITVSATAPGSGEISKRTFDLAAETGKTADENGDIGYTVVYMGELGVLVFSRVV